MILKLLLVALAFTAVLSSEKHKNSYPAGSVPPPEVYAHSAARTNRIIHNFFHNIRMSYPLLDEIEQREIENLGWKPTLVSYAYRSNGTEVLINGTTGEDFLYMHRKMVQAVNDIAEAAGSPWFVDGWNECPNPATETVWLVPPVDTVGLAGSDDYIDYLNYYKTNDFYTNVIVPAQNYLAVDANIEGLTLGELGVKLEYELHTYFHVRFSGYNPIGYRIQSAHPTAFIEEKWDDEDYDYLADFYSAHVNPTFWKIHGWVEKQILRWQSLNLDPSEEITWISTWEYGPLELFDELYKVAEDGAARAGRGDGDDNDAGVIVGSVMGGLVLGMLIALIGFVCMLKIKGKNEAKPHHTHESKPLKNTEVEQK